MGSENHDFFMTLYRESDGATLASCAPCSPDFAPAEEAARLLALRAGRGPWGGNGCRIEPVWSLENGQPHVDGFVVLMGHDADVIQCEFPVSYFSSIARTLSQPLIASGELKDRDLFRYAVTAHPKGDQKGTGIRFEVDDVTASPRVIEGGDMKGLVEVSIQAGPSHAEDIPVFIDDDVIARATSMTKDMSPHETGGILLGRLHRDGPSGDLYMVVHDFVQLQHALSDLLSLTFTSETWLALVDDLKRCEGDCIQVGWWHSHSFYHETCKDCESKGKCSSSAFLSLQDLQVHRTMFSPAYSIALCFAYSPCSLNWKAYGWHKGTIVERGCYVTTGRDETRTSLPEPTRGEETTRERGE